MAALKKVGVLVVAFSALAFVYVRGLSPLMPSPQESDVSATPGPLSAFHAERPGIKTCSSCHTSEGEVAPAKCLSCHSRDDWRIDQAPVVKW
jgi:cytochrome c553